MRGRALPIVDSGGRSLRGQAVWLMVRLCGLWLLLGVVGKSLAPDPAGLPVIVANLADALSISYATMLLLVLTVEGVAAVIAVLLPRLAWPALMLILPILLFVALGQWRIGAESCGCFGAVGNASPGIVLLLDGLLFAGLLALRPWKAASRGRHRPPSPLLVLLTALLVVVAIVAPWTVVRGRMTSATEGRIDPGAWEGRRVAELGLEPWVPTDVVPDECVLVFYRLTCARCAEMLRRYAANPEVGLPLVLIEIEVAVDADTEIFVDTWPPAVYAAIPADVGAAVRTPLEAVVQGGIVTEVRRL